MSLLLDTNACIALINGSSPNVRSRLVSARRRGKEIFLSSIVIYELHFGVAKNHPNRREGNAEKLRVFLANPFPVLPFTTKDSEIAAIVRAELERAGTPIGAYDLLIAAQAIANRLTLITSNQSEFARVSGLRWKNWAVRAMQPIRWKHLSACRSAVPFRSGSSSTRVHRLLAS